MTSFDYLATGFSLVITLATAGSGEAQGGTSPGTTSAVLQEWVLSLDRFRIVDMDEDGGEDEPYLAYVAFRSKLGVAGSTTVWRSDYLHHWAFGGPGERPIPAQVGRVSFPDVEPGSLELLGAVVIALEDDGTPQSTIRELLDSSVEKARAELQKLIESGTIMKCPDPKACFKDATKDITSSMSSGFPHVAALATAPFTLGLSVLIDALVTAGADPDDVIGYSLQLASPAPLKIPGVWQLPSDAAKDITLTFQSRENHAEYSAVGRWYHDTGGGPRLCRRNIAPTPTNGWLSSMWRVGSNGQLFERLEFASAARERERIQREISDGHRVAVLFNDYEYQGEYRVFSSKNQDYDWARRPVRDLNGNEWEQDTTNAVLFFAAEDDDILQVYADPGFGGASMQMCGPAAVNHLNREFGDRYNFPFGRNAISSFRFRNEIRFRWSHAGPISGMNCVRFHESSEIAGHGWENNYLCTFEDVQMQWRSNGPVPGWRCTAVHESREPADTSWGDNFLCVPASSPLHFQYSSAGSIAGLECVLLEEPQDPNSWRDNYLCY